MSSKVERHFMLWVKKSCPYCEAAISDLLETSHQFSTFDMGTTPEQLEKVQNQHQWFTVPVIVEQCSDGERNFIGGYTDLKTHLETVK